MSHHEPVLAVSVVSHDASSDLSLLTQWEKHLALLHQAGYLSFWSEIHLLAGTPRSKIQEHLEQADLIFLLVSPDFFVDIECDTLMKRALERREHSGIRVIPLVLRPVAWQLSPLASLPPLPFNGMPLTMWLDLDAGFHACIESVCILLGRPLPSSSQTHRLTIQQKNRMEMLERLRRFYREQMSQSLQEVVRLDLHLSQTSDVGHNTTNPLSILHVYDEAEHELLIMGEPGTGKSMLMLDLAQHLVKKAEMYETLPLPVILDLSSWAIKRPQLQDWLSEQIAKRYDVPLSLSKQWVYDKQILPLLDGLDEMEETARPSCIAAINAYHEYHRDRVRVPLVVCSRQAEYKTAATRQGLILRRTVVVQSLTPEQVDDHLAKAGKPLAALRNTLNNNSDLQQLATTPLMLNILKRTYQGESISELSKVDQKLKQQVLDDFVERMITKKGKNRGQQKLYPFKDTCLWLSWLAQQMQSHNNQTEFYLEHLQFGWLPTGQQRAYTWLAVRLPGIVIGILTGLAVRFFLSIPTGSPDITLAIASLFQHGILGGFLGGLFSEGIIRATPFQSTQSHSRHSLVTHPIAISIFVGLAYGLSFGWFMIYPSPYGYQFFDWLRDGCTSAIMIGLSCGILLSWSFPQWTSIAPQPAARFWQRFLYLIRTLHTQRLFLLMAVVGAATTLSRALSYGLKDGLNIGLEKLLILGPDFVLDYGIISVLIHLILVKQAKEVQPVDRLTFENLLRSLVKKTHLEMTILLTVSMTILTVLNGALSRALDQVVSIALVNGLSKGMEYLLSTGLNMGLITGLTYGLGYGLIIGLIYWLLTGLFQGVESERIEDKNRRQPNQGIQDSFHNSVKIGLISFFTVGASLCLSIVLCQVLIEWFSCGLCRGLSYALTKGWEANRNEWWCIVCGACSSGILVSAGKGGLAALRHFVVRLLLWHTHTFPWRASQFLEDATARFFLRRFGAGGGYEFTHQLLRDHFADTKNTPPSIL
jgi:hypothetical protein